jgi:hypothetical protein
MRYATTDVDSELTVTGAKRKSKFTQFKTMRFFSFSGFMATNSVVSLLQEMLVWRLVQLD